MDASDKIAQALKISGAIAKQASPSEPQKADGNYRKHHIRIHGLDIALENVRGGNRSGVGHDGRRWTVTMPAHYGYIKRTEGADGDHVDVYVGPDPALPQVYVVDQKDAGTGKFDEHKVMLGFASEAQARATYIRGFSDGKGAQRIQSIKPMHIDQFKDWLKHEDTTKPAGREERSTGGRLDLKHAAEARKRAPGQIHPSKYMPGAPRQVHADGGKVEDDTSKYIYHGTAHSLLPFIAANGLDPEAADTGVTWFYKDPQESRGYAENAAHQMAGPKRKGALLRVHLKHLPLDARPQLSYSDIIATSNHIPPHHIEHEQEDGSWKALAEEPHKAEGGGVDDDGFEAYHGSPHSFDKFSMDKIGTGEGAQAYGHGLYFAEGEDVARGYKNRLSARQDDLLAKYGLEAGGDINRVKNFINQHGEKIENPEAVIAAEAKSMRDELQQLIPQDKDTIDKHVSAWEDKTRRQINYINDPARNGGHMYKVKIKADPNAFLDWDKPLSEQPEAVRRLAGWTPEAEAEYKKALAADTDSLYAALTSDSQYSPTKMPRFHGLFPMDSTGGAFYESSKLVPGEYSDKVTASQKLKEAGIPGIKYLDAGSRGAGEGTRNYVLFHDDPIEILKKYAKGGSTGPLLENMDKLVRKAMMTARKTGSRS